MQHQRENRTAIESACTTHRSQALFPGENFLSSDLAKEMITMTTRLRNNRHNTNPNCKRARPGLLSCQFPYIISPGSSSSSEDKATV